MIIFLFLVFFIICSYNDEPSLYSNISSSYQSITSAMGNVAFIFLRWSHHFASFYTTQFLLNTTLYSPSSFPILHLLPIDSGMTSSFNDIVLNYEDQIINLPVNLAFSDDVRFLIFEDFIYLMWVFFLLRLFLS